MTRISGLSLQQQRYLLADMLGRLFPVIAPLAIIMVFSIFESVAVGGAGAAPRPSHLLWVIALALATGLGGRWVIARASDDSGSGVANLLWKLARIAYSLFMYVAIPFLVLSIVPMIWMVAQEHMHPGAMATLVAAIILMLPFLTILD